MSKNYLSKKWREWRSTVLFITFGILPIKASVASMNFVPTGSMNPTILEGDFVFSNHLAYGLRVPLTDYRLAQWGNPDRGDVVICLSPEDGIRLVKRVIGLPGDEIEMRDRRLFINGEAQEYEPLDQEVIVDLSPALKKISVFANEKLEGRDHPVMATPPLNSPYTSFSKRTLGEGEYFIMGDNRDNSKDSRIFGTVPRSQIVGEATHVVASFNKLDLYQPRWSRFFTKMK